MISVFTPSHDTRFLLDCYESLAAQAHTDWEWVVLLNGNAALTPIPSNMFGDKRVRVFLSKQKIGVGALKREAVEHCSGDILVELDHDDMLLADALDEIQAAFVENPDAGLIYSQCASADEQGNPIFEPFDATCGWRYKQNAKGFTYPLAMDATPHNVSHIWYAPNHVRAFSRTAYDAAGGYDPNMAVLDDQDLMSRLYLQGPFVLIDKVLYVQRTHSGNTQKDPNTNAWIQRGTIDLYDRYIQPAALAWAKREKLVCLDLGGAHNSPEGYLSVDMTPGADIQHKFPSRMRREDSSVGVIRAVDFLEHVEDKILMMNEIHRLLAPGGMLLSMTPSTDGRGAWQDPTHVAFWNENSFWYYTDPEYAKYVPQITARFQVSRMFTTYPTAWHEEHDIPYVCANLIAIKDGMTRNGGMLHW